MRDLPVPFRCDVRRYVSWHSALLCRLPALPLQRWYLCQAHSPQPFYAGHVDPLPAPNDGILRHILRTYVQRLRFDPSFLQDFLLRLNSWRTWWCRSSSKARAAIRLRPYHRYWPSLVSFDSRDYFPQFCKDETCSRNRCSSHVNGSRHERSKRALLPPNGQFRVWANQTLCPTRAQRLGTERYYR